MQQQRTDEMRAEAEAPSREAARGDAAVEARAGILVSRRVWLPTEAGLADLTAAWGKVAAD